ncbi:MAG: dihydrodipicolinate synthase family protein [Candidatus Limiplasma sp.]|nr:dihydrodipicolinate synthase family protein [Candidatus Limiplasma sp.]
MLDLQGICPIIATPFTDRGAVDYDSFRNLAATLLKGGCPAITLFGIAGEYYKLSEEESAKLVDITVEECQRHGGKAIISVTQHATELAVQRARDYQDAGADCLMLLPPFFLKPGAGALYQHMKAVGQAVSIPVMAQYAPEQTGVAIQPGVFAGLFAEAPNIRYYKIECKPAGGYISTLLRETGGKIGVFVGNAGYQFIECFDRGATGVMPGCSMFDIYLKMYRQYTSGDRSAAADTHSGYILPILNHIRQNVEMIIAYEKRILKRRGIIQSDYCRLPSFAPDPYDDRLFDEHYERIAPQFQR